MWSKTVDTHFFKYIGACKHLAFSSSFLGLGSEHPDIAQAKGLHQISASVLSFSLSIFRFTAAGCKGKILFIVFS
jgi:hypothetical protein